MTICINIFAVPFEFYVFAYWFSINQSINIRLHLRLYLFKSLLSIFEILFIFIRFIPLIATLPLFLLYVNLFMAQ